MNEKLVVNKNYNPYTCAPASWDELRKIIEDRYDKLGPGTEQKPIDFNDIDVSEMTTFHNVFKGTKFEYINISNWYAPKVEDMSYMFKNCKNLKSIGNLSNWNVSNVKKIIGVFDNCEQLESVGDLSNWNVSNIRDMQYTFYNCKNLKSVGDLNKWDISNACVISWMFAHSGITNIPNRYKEWHNKYA